MFSNDIQSMEGTIMPSFFHLYLGELIAILFLNEVGRMTQADIPERKFQWDYTDITGLYGCLEKQFLKGHFRGTYSLTLSTEK